MNGNSEKKTGKGLFFWIPVIWNGVSLFVTLVVGITFLIGSRLPSTAEPDLPEIIKVFFTLFDLLLIISPLMLVVMVVLSLFSVMRGSSKTERFLPLVFSGLLQGALSALFLASITQPAG